MESTKEYVSVMSESSGSHTQTEFITKEELPRVVDIARTNSNNFMLFIIWIQINSKNNF